ncbi:hypothetical protein ACJX0J_010330 [Zea mays]
MCLLHATCSSNNKTSKRNLLEEENIQVHHGLNYGPKLCAYTTQPLICLFDQLEIQCGWSTASKFHESPEDVGQLSLEFTQESMPYYLYLSNNLCDDIEYIYLYMWLTLLVPCISTKFQIYHYLIHSLYNQLLAVPVRAAAAVMRRVLLYRTKLYTMESKMVTVLNFTLKN